MKAYKCCDKCDTCSYRMPFLFDIIICLFPWSAIHSWTPKQTRNFCPHYNKEVK